MLTQLPRPILPDSDGSTAFFDYMYMYMYNMYMYMYPPSPTIPLNAAYLCRHR